MRWRRAALCAVACSFVSPGTVVAQACDSADMAFHCPESWGMGFYTSVSLFSGLGVPERAEAGSWSLALEGGLVPQLTDDERRIGFNGTKLEDTNRTPVFGRVRAVVHLTGGVALEAGVVPPVGLNGATPLLFDLGVGMPVIELERVRVGVRAYGQIGGIEGDFTCDAETVAAGTDLARNPFQCEAISEDRIDQRYAGVELSGALLLGDVEPYVFASLNHLDLNFNVNARYSGQLDTRDLGTTGSVWAGGAGVRIAVNRQVRVSGEVFYAPLDVVRPPSVNVASEGLLNLRAMVSYRIRD